MTKQDNIYKEPVIGDFVNGQVTQAAALNLKVDLKIEYKDRCNCCYMCIWANLILKTKYSPFQNLHD